MRQTVQKKKKLVFFFYFLTEALILMPHDSGIKHDSTVWQ